MSPRADTVTDVPAGDQRFTAGLSPDQAAAVRATRGAVCIIAGAGSGKTRTITHRIANQIHCDVARADQVLALTFTERAAGELKARLNRLGITGHVRAATFHAAAFAQIRYFWPRVNETALPQVLDRKVPLLLPLARSAGVEASDLATEIEWAKARLVPPEHYEQAGRHRDAPLPPSQMAAVFARYEALKADRGLIDFDDMLHLAADLMTDRAVAAEVRDRYRFFTVDEFQDVNPAQWRLLRRWLGDRDELCVVGDPDQTIYSFSGATSEYLLDFRSTFPDATVVTLTDNYRSTAPVLDAANRLLRAEWPDAKQLRAQTDDGPRPALMAFDDDTVERARTLDWIRDLVDDGVPIDQIAVCVRTNSQTQAWEEVFERAGVPARVHGDRSFFERSEVRQALQAIRQAVDRPPATPGAAPQPGTRPAAARRPDRVVEQLLRDRMSWHPRREPSGQAARQRWRNLSALHELVTRIVDEDDDIDLAGVVRELAARARTSGGRHPTQPAVTLLTLHKAKGSEFDAVCLVGLEEGMVPISYAVTTEDLAEERRLLYVGMTRARRYLWMSWAQQRPGWSGKLVKRRPSRFLDDLGHGGRVGRRKKATAGDDRLAGALRAWRVERARRDDVPPYVVFNDRTLTELAATRPTSATELLAVHGLGTTKVRRYGSELLGLLAPAASGGGGDAGTSP